MYLLDTNTCIQLLTGRKPQVRNHFLQHSPTEMYLSSIVRAELEYGARHSQRTEDNLALLNEFATPLVALPFDEKCAAEYGIVRENLTRQGKLIGNNDLLIATSALAYDLIMVTHNVGEFERVVGLRIEDWEDSP
jgi:tRNA(fMet)-specific endonuclease VapC